MTAARVGTGYRAGAAAMLVLAVLPAACLPPEWGANAILHPWRRPVVLRPSLPHEDVTVPGEGIALRGWVFRAGVPARGTLVYLHGVADNRQSAIGFAQRDRKSVV